MVNLTIPKAHAAVALAAIAAGKPVADASAKGKAVKLSAICQRPAALPLGLLPGTLDA